MKVREILNELKLDVPDQMVSVQVPLSAIARTGDGDDSEIVNPGLRADSQGNYKWSPPLQQQLDVSKDAVGVSTDEITQDEAEAAADGQDDDGRGDIEDLKKKIVHLLSASTTPMG